MKKVLMFLCWFVFSMAIIGTPNAHANMSVLFTDVSSGNVDEDGAHVGSVYPYDPVVDMSSALLDFDTSTGDYTVTWTATGANPFIGTLDLLLVLQNVSKPNGDILFPELLHRSDYVVAAETTVISYTGNDTDLMNWSIGDEILSQGTFGTGGIGSGGYGSGVHTASDTSYSYYFYDRIWPITSYVTASSALPEPVPVPGAVLLGMLGLSVAGVKLRKHA